MLNKEQKASGNKINSFIMRGRYNEAIALAKKELKQLPHNDWDTHWLYSQLSSAYYEKRKYKTALRYSSKAYDIQPYCPMTIWHYAGDLLYFGPKKNIKIAADLYHSLLERSLNDIAYGVCGEGKECAIGIRSDCRICLVKCYFEIKELQKAHKWAKLFLRYYPKNNGVSIYKKESGLKWLKRIEKEIANESRKKANR